MLVAFTLVGSGLLLVLLLPLLNLVLTTEWSTLAAAWSEPGAARAVRLSAWTSTASVGVMALVGIPLGYVLARGRFPGKPLLICLVALPMVLPGLAGGVLLLLTFGPLGTVGQVSADLGLPLHSNSAGIILAQLYVAAPFVIITSMVAFNAVEPQLEIAAATLGDSPWTVFRRVSLPLALPTITAGLVLAWVRALGEFGATMILAYNPQTLPVHLWVRFQAGGLREALPLALLLVVLAGLAIVVWRAVGRITPQSNPDRMIEPR
ncbi:ABC transporter permease [Aeromicrobium sp. CF4.19]|uniref:ABC transporter permease n=1 Tax=Aeromicrobium sp. CF4.19 TaxID=3373082 RepID=UPI003EE61688